MTVMIISGIAIDVQRKKVKNLNLRVTQDCCITLSVPYRTSDRQIREFVESKREWIERSIERFKDSSNRSDQWFGDGGRISVLGNTCRVVEIDGTKLMCQIDGDTAYITRPPDCTYDEKERYMREWYRSILKGILPDLFIKWEMTTGMRCSEYRTRYMKTRWGTCNHRTKVIWMNVRLAEKPLECIEYVVLHELVHTVVPNHGPEFKAYLDRYMPDWKERRKVLNYGIRSE